MKDNKGFAIAGLLYTLLIVFLALIFSFLLMLNNRKTILDQIKKDVYNDLSGILKDELVITGPTYEEPKNTETHEGIAYLNPEKLDEYCYKENSKNNHELKNGCMKWYVIYETDQAYTLILDHNIVSNVETPTIDTVNRVLEENTQSWSTEIKKIRTIKANEVARFSEDSFDSTSDTYTKTISIKNSPWLYDYTYKCIENGNCNYEISVDSRGYLIDELPKDQTNTDGVWRVDYRGILRNKYGIVGYANNYGIRPVIEISKKYFE